MKYAWITGRFLFAGLILVAVFISMGSRRPLAVFSSTDGSEESTASTSSETDATDDEPIGKAEDLVKDWAKPKFVLFVTGRQHGYIEPCGCITLARQKGGLMRRHTVQKLLEDRGWDVVPLDAGNQVRRFGQQPVVKLRKTYEALCREMDYDMIGIGPDDLKLPSLNLVSTLEAAKNGTKNPFTSANVELYGGSFTNEFVVIERGGKRIGVTMVLGEEHLESLVGKDNIKAVSPEEGLKRVQPKLEEAKCDMKVLFAFSSPSNCRKLAEKFPIFDLLVTAGGAGDPTLQPEIIEAGNHVTSMIQVGVKGMYVGLIAYYEKDGRSEIKYERVQLDHRYSDSENMKVIFKAYQDELKTLWETNSLEDIAPREHPSGHTFVGSESCADCHADEFDIWENGIDGSGGPHFEATESLEQNPNDDRVWVQRHFDPECISCHATGWNPQNFYPYKSGMLDVKKQKHLHANGCENCHGPGSAHVEMEKKAARGPVDKELKKRLADEMILTLAEARDNACKECHDIDNSPDFLLEGGFDEYWPEIEHGGD